MADLIDRQAAIDECYPVTVDGEVYEVVQVETLIGLPSAQPEREGHWIVNVEEESTISGSCSSCGWQAHLYEDDVVGMNFCPNCGAKMGGERDERY